MTATQTICPPWCVTEHAPGKDSAMHHSPALATADSGIAMTASLIRLDPEPGYDATTHEAWVTVGDFSFEVDADQLPAFARQLRHLAAHIELLNGQPQVTA